MDVVDGLSDELNNLYRFIDENWSPITSNSSSNAEKRLSWYKHVRVYQSDDSVAATDFLATRLTSSRCVQKSLCESSFYAALKSRKWMLAECSRCLVSFNKIEMVGEVKVKKPSEVFFRDQSMFQRVYGSHAAYSICVSSSEKSTLGNDLGKEIELKLAINNKQNIFY